MDIYQCIAQQNEFRFSWGDVCALSVARSICAAVIEWSAAAFDSLRFKWCKATVCAFFKANNGRTQHPRSPPCPPPIRPTIPRGVFHPQIFSLKFCSAPKRPVFDSHARKAFLSFVRTSRPEGLLDEILKFLARDLSFSLSCLKKNHISDGDCDWFTRNQRLSFYSAPVANTDQTNNINNWA